MTGDEQVNRLYGARDRVSRAITALEVGHEHTAAIALERAIAMLQVVRDGVVSP